MSNVKNVGNWGMCRGFVNYNIEKAKASMEQQNEEEEILFAATCFIAANSSKNSWLIDGGCTNHITNNLKLFNSLIRRSFPK